MNLTPEQQALKQAAHDLENEPGKSFGHKVEVVNRYQRLATPAAILAILAQLEAQEAPPDSELLEELKELQKEYARQNDAFQFTSLKLKIAEADLRLANAKLSGAKAYPVQTGAGGQPVQAAPKWKWTRFEDWLASPITYPGSQVEYVRLAFDAGRTVPTEPSQ